MEKGDLCTVPSCSSRRSLGRFERGVAYWLIVVHDFFGSRPYAPNLLSGDNRRRSKR